MFVYAESRRSERYWCFRYNGGTDRNSTLSDGWNVSGNAIVYGGKTICQISDVDDDADTIDLSALDMQKGICFLFFQ